MLDLSALAQESPAANPSSASPKAFQWNATLDAYGSNGWNGPPSSGNGLRCLENCTGQLRLGGVAVDLDYKFDHFAAHLTGGYEDRYSDLPAGDTVHGANSYLAQYYVTFRPLKESGLTFDVGKFYANAGAESPETQANFNYSRSVLLNFGEPLDHFGLRAAVPLTRDFSVGGQVLQSGNYFGDNNSEETYAVTTTLAKPRWGWSQMLMFGPEKDGAKQGIRHTYNEVFTVSPWPGLQGYIEVLYGRDRRSNSVSGWEAWYGVASAARWNLARNLSFNPRLEYYVDQTGFTTGTVQHLKEITATAEYRPHPIVTTRLEYREDFSNQPFFQGAGNRQSRRQGTILLAVLLALKGER